MASQPPRTAPNRSTASTAYALQVGLNRQAGGRTGDPADQRRVPVTNYLRMPTMATALTFFLFLPGMRTPQEHIPRHAVAVAS